MSETTATVPNLFAIVSAAEGDMRSVYDHAWLIHDHLSRAGRLTEDEQGALVWPAGHLLRAGDNLRDHCDKLYQTARQIHALNRLTRTADIAPTVDPSKLTIDQCFGLFTALGVVYEVMSGLLCQAKFQGAEGVLNAPGEMLDRIQEIIGDARDAIRQEALSREASGASDRSRKVFFVAEEWVDGLCDVAPALKGLTTALRDLGGTNV